MRELQYTFSLICLLFVAGCGGGAGSGGNNPPPVQNGNFVVTAWAELGMHCMDGKDYSVFSILPPYNTIRAQVVRRSEPPAIVSSGITVTYQAVADATGSVNTYSSGKTNFWTYVQALFGANAAPEIGLTGLHTQTTVPYPMNYNATLGYWEAVGIPTVPFDDAGIRNAYPMVRVVAKDSNGTVIATADIVTPVSDEITCGTCHASNSDPAAMPAAGWENNPDPAKDMKFNILKKHDDRWNVSAQVAALQPSYNYQASLYQTAKSGTPVLCATCHASNALGTAGVAGANPLTSDMHTLHGSVVNPATNVSLDNATTPADSCYLCHPGATTKCQRGAMRTVACFDCHGNLTKVGASTRQGWLDLPACQMCHNGGTRYTTTFDSGTGNWRLTNDPTFATMPNVPLPGKSLYRFSTGHGSMYCSSCHGSQHAEFPTLQPNDNVYSTDLQGYQGKLVECTVCHARMPATTSGGPHGLHEIGTAWVTAHQDAAQGNLGQCAYCHGADYRGTPLSALSTARTLNQRTFAAGHQMNCYDCHNGPSPG